MQNTLIISFPKFSRLIRHIKKAAFPILEAQEKILLFWSY